MHEIKQTCDLLPLNLKFYQGLCPWLAAPARSARLHPFLFLPSSSSLPLSFFCALLCFTALYCALLCFTVPYRALVCCTVPHCAFMCFTVLYCASLCLIVLYYALLCFTDLETAAQLAITRHIDLAAIIQQAAPQAAALAQVASSGPIHPPKRSPHKDRYAEPCDCGVKSARVEENKRRKAQGKRTSGARMTHAYSCPAKNGSKKRQMKQEIESLEKRQRN